ncbi:MAG: hypothetical protein IH609_16540 [Dehalococcoidia bacterium]|nr:hypothetical protein [Dehalococcoidia bacterium]
MIWYVTAFLCFLGASTFARYDPDVGPIYARVRVALFWPCFLIGGVATVKVIMAI